MISDVLGLKAKVSRVNGESEAKENVFADAQVPIELKYSSRRHRAENGAPTCLPTPTYQHILQSPQSLFRHLPESAR